MKMTEEQKSFIRDNNRIIQEILEGKLEDIFNDMLYDKDEDKRKTARLWAVEVKELISALDNFTDVKEINKNTGI